MPNSALIRTWRFNSQDSTWVRRSLSPEQSFILSESDVEYPAGLPRPSQGDFLFQQVPARPHDPPTGIRGAEIFGVVPNSKVPSDSDVWYWNGADQQDDAFTRIHRRRGRSEERAARRSDQLARIQAAVDPDATAEGQVIILLDGGSLLTFSKGGKPQEVYLEASEGTIDWAGALTAGDYDEFGLLTLLSAGLTANKDRLMAAFKDSDEGRVEAAGKAVLEVIQGATPGPTQGHNVAHSLPAALDDIHKLHEICHSNVASDEASGFIGGFGQGVGVVDNGWQALGSLLTFMENCLTAYKVQKASGRERDDRFGGRAVSGAAASIISSGSKTAAGGMKAFEAIRTLSSAAPTAVSIGVTASGLGAVTSAIALVRGVHQTRKAHKRVKALKAMDALKKEAGHGEGNVIVIRGETERLLAYAMAKAQRKRAFKAAESGVAATGTVGGIVLAVGATVAASTAWNPVGWGIGIAVLALGAGLLTYKIYRRVTSSSRAKKIGFSREQFPRELVKRYLHLKSREGSTTRSQRTNERRSFEILLVEAILYAYGVEPWRCLFAPDIPLLEARIARHLA